MTAQELQRLQSIASTAGQEFATRGVVNAPVKPRKKVGGLRAVIANALPIIGSTAGTAIGAAGTPVGMAVGGGLGGAAGEYLRQKILGEDTNLGRIALEGGLGALPGVTKGAANALKGAKAAKAASAAASMAGSADDVGRVISSADDVVRVTKGAKAATKGAKAAKALTSTADDLIAGSKTAILKSNAEGARAKALQTALKKGTSTKEVASSAEFLKKATEKAAKSEKVVGKAAKAVTNTVDDAAATATKAVTKKPNVFQRMGGRLTEGASGLKLEKAPGATGDIASQADFMRQFTGTPRQQLGKMDKAMATLSGQVDDALKASKVKIDGLGVAKSMVNIDPTDTRFVDLDLSPNAMKYVSRYAEKTKNFTDANQINNLLKTINGPASKAREILMNPTGKTLTAQQNALLAVKRHLDDVLTAVPEIKPFKTQMAKIYDIYPDVVAASRKVIGAPGLGIKSQSLAQSIKGAESYIGAGLQGFGKAAEGPTGSFLGRMARASVPQVGYRAGAALMTGAPFAGYTDGAFSEDTEQQPAVDYNNEMTTSPILDELNSQYGSTATPPMQPASEQPVGFFSDPARAEQAYMRALMAGDKEAAGMILDGINTFSKINAANTKAASSSSTGGVSKVTAQNYSNAQSGMQSLEDLKTLLEQDPGALSRSAMPGRKLPILGGYISNAVGTGDFDAIGYNIADTLLRIRTGAQANESEIRNLQSQIMPRAGDSPDTIRTKLRQLTQAYQNILSLAGDSNLSTPTEVPEAQLI